MNYPNFKNKEIKKALEFAALAHAGQKRKGTNIPYIVHPVSVTMILISVGCSNEEIVAGLLLDTIEDTKITLDDINSKFGSEICSI